MKKEKITSLILTTVLCINNSLPVLAAESEIQEAIDNTSTIENELNNEINIENSIDNIDLNKLLSQQNLYNKAVKCWLLSK